MKRDIISSEIPVKDKQEKVIYYKTINFAIMLLLSLSLFFSLQSKILWLDHLSYKFIVCLFVELILIYFLLMFLNKKHFTLFLAWLSKHQQLLFWCFFLGCSFYQLFLFNYLKSTPSFDAGLLLRGLTDQKAVADYLSINNNNQLLFFFNYFLSHLFGSKISSFQVFNAVLLFGSMLLFKQIATKLFNQTTGYLATMFLMFYSIIQPLYLVPYTDTYCLLPLFLSIHFLVNIREWRHSLAMLYINVFFSAFFLVIAYLIRPSSVTFIIAVLIFFVINAKQKSVKTLGFKVLPIYIATIVLSLLSFQLFINTQKIVPINHSKATPIMHFLLLGSSGDEDSREALHGTWNSKDIKTTYSGKTKAERSALAFRALKERTKARGAARTIKFYLQKYIQNTDAGVVGYHRDGLWLHSVYSPKGTKQHSIQQIYNEDGRLRPTFNFICQIVWIVTLFFSVIAVYRNRQFETAIVALTLFGGLLFLELFESGGTKYLFQYLPWICLLAGVGAQILFTRLSQKPEVN